ncbi:hypothetical protein L1887_01358 [Cichorium endivia]|nr:hypothetical protein L1887_01358 [Cichorium endivia]
MNPLRYDFYQFALNVSYCPNITSEYLSHMWISVYQSDWQNTFSKPMPWIGIYITLASLFCILAMVADLFHGLRNRRLWFPCKYFTLNAASLTVIAVAIKLPMDLTNLMPGYVDQGAKIGGLGFMCIMMANALPSLGTMDNKELVTNMIALGVLEITLVVNVCIQINTGVISYYLDEAEYLQDFSRPGTLSLDSFPIDQTYTATLYVVCLLMLLIIYACSSLAILKSKQILDLKYQVAHQTALKDQELQQRGRLSVHNLKQHVSNYWLMAQTGSPQFMTACSVTTSASGVICAFLTILHFNIIPLNIKFLGDYKSDYNWSTLMIFVIQFVGVILGTVAPFSRCFAALSFKVSIKRLQKHVKVSKVEKYWTEKLSDWKQSTIPFPSSGRKCKIVIQNFKFLILSFCIGFQKTVVVACKLTTAIPIFLVICVLYCFRCWKWSKAMLSTTCIDLAQNSSEQLGKDKDPSRYVLQLEEDIEFAERTLKGISESMNRLIQKAEKQQPRNLMKLLEESKGFEGVAKFDSHHVPPLLSEEYLNCWSLPLVTMTTIAMSLPNIQKNRMDCLRSGVGEGLAYVTLVEESFNGDEVVIRKVANTLWLEVDFYHKWLGNKLPKYPPQVNTSGHILQWLRDTAKNVVTEAESIDIGDRSYNFKCRSISANSMYRITETILLSYHANIDRFSQEELFAELSSMIADILAACLTNLPQVIAMKCHTSVREKREASVQAAAQLLGETTQIINNLHDRELPSLNQDELASIDKWVSFLRQPFL